MNNEVQNEGSIVKRAFKTLDAARKNNESGMLLIFFPSGEVEIFPTQKYTNTEIIETLEREYKLTFLQVCSGIVEANAIDPATVGDEVVEEVWPQLKEN